MNFKLIKTREDIISLIKQEKPIFIEIKTIHDLKDLYDKYGYELAIDFNRMVIEIINGYRE
jgi:hypothetical protein